MEKNKNDEKLGLVRTAHFEGNSVDFVVLGPEKSKHNPLVLVPGYTEGFVALGNFARALALDRQVALSEPPFSKIDILNRITGQAANAWPSALDLQAKALLAIIASNRWAYRPVDFVSHSMGSVTLVRAAEIAKDFGWSCFQHEQGSNSVMISPAGSNKKEGLMRAAPRFGSLLMQIQKVDKKLNRTIADNGGKVWLKNPLLRSREMLGPAINRPLDYESLADLGLYPAVLGYPNDPMYAYERVGANLEANAGLLNGYSMPIDKKVRAGKLKHYRNAGHNDLLYNPARTARTVRSLLSPE